MHHDPPFDPIPKRRVLIVDDDADAVWPMQVLLRRKGYEARVATDGGEALRVAEDFRPDVILLDIAMPEMSGIEIARWIRTQPWGSDAFVIALTGWGHSKTRALARSAGFDAYLLKPVASTDVVELIERHV